METMFSRKNPKSETPGGINVNSIEVQTDFGIRTYATNTEVPSVRTIACSTEIPSCVDREISMDTLPSWDASVQFNVPIRDAGVDPGDWNSTRMCGVEAQTESQDLRDPFFWLTGSSAEVNDLISNLLQMLEEFHLQTPSEESSGKGVRDSLQLRADNTLLRIEVAELKRKLNAASSTNFGRTLLGGSETWTPLRPSTAGLTGGYTKSDTFEVVKVGSEGFLSVTSSLAPSSYAIGRLRKGDRVLTAGQPEEILGLVRGPILPRGWITLKDSSDVYLSKVLPN